MVGSFSIMTHHSPPNKVWLWLEDGRPNATIEEPPLSLLTLEPFTSASPFHSRYPTNRENGRIFSDNIMTSDHMEIKISNLQQTGSTLGKHEHVYRTEPIASESSGGGRKAQGKRETEQSMLAYTNKMQEISARKGGTIANDQMNANTSTPVTQVAGKRWATLHKLRRQTLELTSVSDSQWNYGAYKRQMNNPGPKGRALQRPKSEVHQTSTNKDIPRRPRSDSDGIIYHSSFLQGKALNNNLDMYPVNHSRLKGDTNILSLPDITASVDSFNMQSAVEIVPFPGIEVQAVSVKLHTNVENSPKDRKSVQQKPQPSSHTFKLSSQSMQPVQVHSQKTMKKILKYQDRGKSVGSSRVKQSVVNVPVTSETVNLQRPPKVKKVPSSNAQGKNNKEISSIHKKYAKATHSNNSTGSEKQKNLTSSSPSEDIPGVGENSDKSTGIKSVLRTSGKKKGKHRNSVHFGPQMIREVTKIVYPWNAPDKSDSSEEEYDDQDDDYSDDEDEHEQTPMQVLEYDSDDYIYTDEDENEDNDL